jgi:hypothetical protein
MRKAASRSLIPFGFASVPTSISAKAPVKVQPATLLLCRLWSRPLRLPLSRILARRTKKGLVSAVQVAVGHSQLQLERVDDRVGSDAPAAAEGVAGEGSHAREHAFFPFNSPPSSLFSSSPLIHSLACIPLSPSLLCICLLYCIHCSLLAFHSRPLISPFNIMHFNSFVAVAVSFAGVATAAPFGAPFDNDAGRPFMTQCYTVMGNENPGPFQTAWSTSVSLCKRQTQTSTATSTVTMSVSNSTSTITTMTTTTSTATNTGVTATNSGTITETTTSSSVCSFLSTCALFPSRLSP